MLEPCLLQPCFHVVVPVLLGHQSSPPRPRRRALARTRCVGVGVGRPGVGVGRPSVGVGVGVDDDAPCGAALPRRPAPLEAGGGADHPGRHLALRAADARAQVDLVASEQRARARRGEGPAQRHPQGCLGRPIAQCVLLRGLQGYCYCLNYTVKRPQFEETNMHIFLNHTFLEES